MSKTFLVRWTDGAVADLVAIREWYERRNPEAGRRLLTRLYEAVADVAHDPLAHPLATDLAPPGRYRHRVVRPYRILFRIDAEAVLILRVWDARRDPGELTVET